MILDQNIVNLILNQEVIKISERTMKIHERLLTVTVCNVGARNHVTPSRRGSWTRNLNMSQAWLQMNLRQSDVEKFRNEMKVQMTDYLIPVASLDKVMAAKLKKEVKLPELDKKAKSRRLRRKARTT